MKNDIIRRLYTYDLTDKQLKELLEQVEFTFENIAEDSLEIDEYIEELFDLNDIEMRKKQVEKSKKKKLFNFKSFKQFVMSNTKYVIVATFFFLTITYDETVFTSLFMSAGRYIIFFAFVFYAFLTFNNRFVCFVNLMLAVGALFTSNIYNGPFGMSYAQYLLILISIATLLIPRKDKQLGKEIVEYITTDIDKKKA